MKIKIKNSETIVLELSLLLLLLLETNLMIKFTSSPLLLGLNSLSGLFLMLIIIHRKKQILLTLNFFILKFLVVFFNACLFQGSQLLLITPFYLFIFFQLFKKEFKSALVFLYLLLIPFSFFFFTFSDFNYLVAISGIILVSSFIFFNSNLKAQDEARESNFRDKFQQLSLSSLSTLASGIAHEVNNPLMVVKGSASIIHKKTQKGIFDQENFLKHTETIEETVDRISKVVTSLKNLSRNGSLDDQEPFLFKELWNDIDSLLTTKIKLSEIKFKVPKEDPLFSEIVYAQRVQLGQVFINLIKNAYDAIINQESKWIEIQLDKDSQAPEKLIVRVIDSGNGLTKDKAQKVFHPFFTTKDIGSGTGLGLSLCRAIMESNHGSISYVENHPNTCFEVRIPIFKHTFS